MSPEQSGGQLNDRWHERSLEKTRHPAREIDLVLPTAELRVRTEGALIKDLFVGERRVLVSTDTVDPITGANFDQPPKTDGTISMFPVGSDESGPQHGFSRYLEYKIYQSGGDKLVLSGHDRLLNVDHHKTFWLQPDGLSIIDDVMNLNTTPQALSLGEHCYFPINEARLGEIRLVDQFGDTEWALMKFKDGSGTCGPLSACLDEVRTGHTVYIPSERGIHHIWIPNLGTVTLDMAAHTGRIPEDTGLLVWHRKDTNTICFEPATGCSIDYQGKMRNNGITLLPGESVQLHTRVSLKQ